MSCSPQGIAFLSMFRVLFRTGIDPIERKGFEPDQAAVGGGRLPETGDAWTGGIFAEHSRICMISGILRNCFQSRRYFIFLHDRPAGGFSDLVQID